MKGRWENGRRRTSNTPLPSSLSGEQTSLLWHSGCKPSRWTPATSIAWLCVVCEQPSMPCGGHAACSRLLPVCLTLPRHSHLSLSIHSLYLLACILLFLHWTTLRQTDDRTVSAAFTSGHRGLPALRARVAFHLPTIAPLYLLSQLHRFCMAWAGAVMIFTRQQACWAGHQHIPSVPSDNLYKVSSNLYLRKEGLRAVTLFAHEKAFAVSAFGMTIQAYLRPFFAGRDGLSNCSRALPLLDAKSLSFICSIQAALLTLNGATASGQHTIFARRLVAAQQTNAYLLGISHPFRFPRLLAAASHWEENASMAACSIPSPR